MKTLTIRLPDVLAAQIEAESRERNMSKSDIVRERLAHADVPGRKHPSGYELIADLVGSVKGLPPDLSSRKKHYLKAGYGRRKSAR